MCGLFLSLLLWQTAFAETVSTSFNAEPASKNALKPSIFLYEAKPGAVIEDKILIKNTSDQKQELTIYGADGFTDANDKSAFKTNGEEMAEIGAWVELESSSYTFDPQETKKLSFIIRIPENTEEKIYKGGLALEQMFNSQATVQTALRVMKNIELKVTQNPQDIPKLKVETPAFEPTLFFWITLVIFILSMTYVIVTSKKNHEKKQRKNH